MYLVPWWVFFDFILGSKTNFEKKMSLGRKSSRFSFSKIMSFFYEFMGKSLGLKNLFTNVYCVQDIFNLFLNVLYSHEEDSCTPVRGVLEVPD